MKKNLVVSMLLLFFATALFAQKPTFVRNIEGVKEYAMSNGMKVLLIPDPTQSNAVVNIVYEVGSRHEGYGETGMAHLLEHMLFKSTKNLGDIKAMLSEKGGNANGTTWLDRTNYYEVFTSNDENLKWFLEMEADRMINATILQEDLDKEFSVVRNEFEIGENDPGGVLNERIISSAYLWHNYGNSTIGSKEDIERVKADRLRKFYEKYYQPDNATLIVAGKFNEEKALEYIGEFFSPIPRPERKLEKTYTVEPAQDGERYVELRRAGDVQIIGAAYHTAAYADEDFVALEALSDILTSDPTGHLYKALVETQKASSLYAWQPTTRDPSYMYFNVEVPKDKNLNDAKTTFLNELDNIGDKEYTQEELDRSKTKMLKYIEDAKNNTVRFAIGLTEIIGAGDYRLAFLYRDRVEALTLDDIQRVAAKYFIPTNRTYGVFIPSENPKRIKPAEVTDEKLASLTQDYQGRALEEALPEFDASIDNILAHTNTYTLDNGLEYSILTKPIKGNKVMASFTLPVGNLDALQNKAMVAEIMTQMLKSGTANKTKTEIDDLLNQMKSSLRFGFSGQKFYVTVNTYEEYLTPTFELLDEILSSSNFPQNEFEKVKLEEKTYLQGLLNDPQSIAFTELNKKGSNYPPSHPLYTQSAQESIDALDTVTREQVTSFYKQLLDASHGKGAIIGNISNEVVKPLITKVFGDLTSNVEYAKLEEKFHQTTKSSERIITPDKENATAALVQTLRLRQDDADYPAFVIADQILGSGGFLSSRIPMRLREKDGISYGAGSFLSVPRDTEISSWGAYAFYNPTKVDAVESALKEEIAKALDAGFTEEELKKNVTSWKNERSTNLGNDQYVLNQLKNSLLYDYDLTEFDELEAKVDRLSVDDVNQIVKKYLDTDKMTIIMAGDFEKK